MQQACPKRLRQRIAAEDGLLNSRTGLFLFPNGLLAAAVGVASDDALRFYLSLLGFSVTLIWFLAALQSWLVIRALVIALISHPDDDPVEAIVQKALFPWHPFRPTNLLAFWLPGLFLVAWVAIAITSR